MLEIEHHTGVKVCFGCVTYLLSAGHSVDAGRSESPDYIFLGGKGGCGSKSLLVGCEDLQD